METAPAQRSSTAMTRKLLLDPLDVMARIGELKQLRPGWLNGKGQVPSPASLDWLAGALNRHRAADVPSPYLFLTPEGRVLAEWSMKPWSPSLEIDTAQRRGQWHLLNVDTDEEAERRLDMSDADDWSWLSGELRRLAGSQE